MDVPRGDVAAGNVGLSQGCACTYQAPLQVASTLYIHCQMCGRCTLHLAPGVVNPGVLGATIAGLPIAAQVLEAINNHLPAARAPYSLSYLRDRWSPSSSLVDAPPEHNTTTHTVPEVAADRRRQLRSRSPPAGSLRNITLSVANQIANDAHRRPDDDVASASSVSGTPLPLATPAHIYVAFQPPTRHTTTMAEEYDTRSIPLS